VSVTDRYCINTNNCTGVHRISAGLKGICWASRKQVGAEKLNNSRLMIIAEGKIRVNRLRLSARKTPLTPYPSNARLINHIGEMCHWIIENRRINKTSYTRAEPR